MQVIAGCEFSTAAPWGGEMHVLGYFLPVGDPTVEGFLSQCRDDRSRRAEGMVQKLNAAGVAIRRDSTGQAGSEVGQELDVVLNFHLSKHADVLVGYSHLWAGDFLRNTRGNAGTADAGQFFIQTSYRW